MNESVEVIEAAGKVSSPRKAFLRTEGKEVRNADLCNFSGGATHLGGCTECWEKAASSHRYLHPDE